MDHRDDWPDGLLEGDLDSARDLDPETRRSAERIMRDARNMNSLLSAMANRLSESSPVVENAQAVPLRRRPAGGWRTMVPLAAAAAIAALVLMRGEGIEESGGPDNLAGAPPATNMMAEMDVEADKPFVVFPTSDPDIAVVWLLNPKESD